MGSMGAIQERGLTGEKRSFSKNRYFQARLKEKDRSTGTRRQTFFIDVYKQSYLKYKLSDLSQFAGAKYD